MPLRTWPCFTDFKNVLSSLKSTLQNAGKCISEYSSKQNFPGMHAPVPP